MTWTDDDLSTALRALDPAQNLDDLSAAREHAVLADVQERIHHGEAGSIPRRRRLLIPALGGIIAVVFLSLAIVVWHAHPAAAHTACETPGDSVALCHPAR